MSEKINPLKQFSYNSYKKISPSTPSDNENEQNFINFNNSNLKQFYKSIPIIKQENNETSNTSFFHNSKKSLKYFSSKSKSTDYKTLNSATPLSNMIPKTTTNVKKVHFNKLEESKTPKNFISTIMNRNKYVNQNPFYNIKKITSLKKNFNSKKKKESTSQEIPKFILQSRSKSIGRIFKFTKNFKISRKMPGIFKNLKNNDKSNHDKCNTKVNFFNNYSDDDLMRVIFYCKPLQIKCNKETVTFNDKLSLLNKYLNPFENSFGGLLDLANRKISFMKYSLDVIYPKITLKVISENNKLQQKNREIKGEILKEKHNKSIFNLYFTKDYDKSEKPIKKVNLKIRNHAGKNYLRSISIENFHRDDYIYS